MTAGPVLTRVVPFSRPLVPVTDHVGRIDQLAELIALRAGASGDSLLHGRAVLIRHHCAALQSESRRRGIRSRIARALVTVYYRLGGGQRRG